jgi:serine/threonine protein phosphatase PrpC
MQDTITGLESGAATHVGKVRHGNEDSYLVAARSGIWAVADGMGGLSAGDVASRTVVDELATLGEPLSAEDLLTNCEDRLVNANSRLRALADERGVMIGTTVAVLLIFWESYACLWSGDSRIYRIRQGEIDQLSVDHTEAQELVAEGKLTAAEARAWPRRNVVTRAIGVFDIPEFEMVSGTLEPGDVFVICSDGLTAHVEEDEILAIAAGNTPQRACELLIDLTLERGAVDNVTVVAVRFDPADSAALPGTARDNVQD